MFYGEESSDRHIICLLFFLAVSFFMLLASGGQLLAIASGVEDKWEASQISSGSQTFLMSILNLDGSASVNLFILFDQVYEMGGNKSEFNHQMGGPSFLSTLARISLFVPQLMQSNTKEDSLGLFSALKLVGLDGLSLRSLECLAVYRVVWIVSSSNQCLEAAKLGRAILLVPLQGFGKYGTLRLLGSVSPLLGVVAGKIDEIYCKFYGFPNKQSYCDLNQVDLGFLFLEILDPFLTTCCSRLALLSQEAILWLRCLRGSGSWKAS